MSPALHPVLTLLQTFLKADLVERDVGKALSLLSRNICWFGTGENEDVSGLKEAERYLRAEVRNAPGSYVVEFLECAEQKQAMVAFAKCRVTGGGVQMCCRCSASACMEDGALKICTLHMSVPDTTQQEGEFFPFSMAEQYERELHDEFLNDFIEGGVVGGYCEPGFPLYLVNRQLLAFLGYDTEAEFRAAVKGYVINCIHKDDREKVGYELSLHATPEDHWRAEYRMLRKDGSIVWVEAYGKQITVKSGRQAIVSIIHDISGRKDAARLSEEKNMELRNLYDTIPGGVFICKYNSAWDVTFANQGFYDFLGYSREEFADRFHNQMIHVIYEEDRAPMRSILEAQLQTGNYIENINRLVCRGGVVKWISIHAVLNHAEGKMPFFYCTFVDITAQKLAEQQLRNSEQRYRLAIEGAGVNVWEYDILKKRIILPDNSPKVQNGKLVVENFPDSVIPVLGLSAEQEQEMRALFQKIAQGVPKVSGDFWVISPVSHTRWCERITYSVVFDEQGKPVKAYGASIDVTQSKLAEKRYHEELSYRDSVSDSVIAACCVNLTAGYVETMRVGGKSRLEEKYRNTLDFRQRTSAFLSYNEMTEEQNHRFSPEALRDAYAGGVVTDSQEYLARAGDPHYLWMRTDVNLVKHPETDDLLAFFYHYDLTQEKIHESVMGTALSLDYTEVGIVDLRTGTYEQVAGNSDYPPANQILDYSQGIAQFCDNCVAAADRERVSAEIALDALQRTMKENGVLKLQYLGLLQNGDRRHFILRYQYLRNNCDVLLMTRQDIDSVVRKEQEKQRQLEMAVSEAERANQVKSEFLSRMSHEIRTPLNAIIGLAELGRENLHGDCPSKEDGKDYIDKTLDASHYLLSLINDILDMSKIESGEITLSCEPMDCRHILRSVDTIIRTQAELKGVRFRVAQNTECSEPLLGDATRVQQILINLLNNAVKFTKEGGEVCLTIDRLPSERSAAVIRFRVEDTGVGISPAFMSQLFDPFTQEYSGSTTSYGGSGLGLAIARRLCRLMGGDLTAESQKGKGSVFTAVLHFCIPESQTAGKSAPGDSAAPETQLQGRHLLLCEDHPINTMVVKRLLERRGCTVDCAENGAQGVRAFLASEKGTYDAVLMDIRMPVMDGLTAAKEIRASSHPDAGTIPILAMTANAYEEDERLSREAGMNAHLSKPVEPEALYRTLSQLIGEAPQD